MTKYYGNTEYTGYTGLKRKKPKNPWIIALKAVCWTIGSLIVLTGITFWIICAYITPEHITKIIEEKSGDYLNAEIKLKGLDYKVFSSYPWLEFEVDSLAVVSESLDGISLQTKEEIPSNYPLLASVEKIKGKINIHSLIHHKINLKDIEISKPFVNIVIVNDSLNNFNIAKKIPHISKIPKIKISEIKIGAPVDFNFFSLIQDIEAKVNVESFYLTEQSDKYYKIGFDGVAQGHYKDYEIPGELPLKFTTSIQPDLSHLKLNLSDLSVSLAGLTLSAKGNLMADYTGFDIANAQVNVKIDDLFSLIKYLPSKVADEIAIPDGISGFLPIDFSAEIKNPFYIANDSFSRLILDSLPAIEANLKIEDGNLSMTPPKAKKLVADDICLDVVCDFDPRDSESSRLIVNTLRMDGEGLWVSGSAEVSNLTGEKQPMKGDLHFSTSLMETLSYMLPKSSMKVAGYLKGHIEFSTTANNMGKDGFKDLSIGGEINTHSLKVAAGKTATARLTNMQGSIKANIPSYPLTNYAGTKIDFSLLADSVSTNTNGVNLLLSSLAMNLNAMDTVSGSPDPFGSLNMKIKGLTADDGSNKFNAENLDMSLRGTLNSTGNTPNYTVVAPTSGGDDAMIESRIKHTPMVLEYNGGGIMQAIMSMATMTADLKVGKGKFSSPTYLYPFEFSGVKLSTNLNKADISASEFKIGRSALSLSSQVEGLMPFILSNSATPIKARADINLNNVDINQLSWGYYGALLAKGADSVFYVPPVLPYTASDSVCVVIPRNIDADIKLRSSEAEYMQFTFAPLSTEIIVKNGDATLSQLTVGTPYATAIVDWTYSTSHLDNIYMDLKAKVKDFSFRNFYEIFPSLTAQAPELHNFTGLINADINCNFLMFPNMFMNAQSLCGKFDIKGTELQFARTGKIERITHLMLIEGNEPIHIQNLDITGGFHDSFLQINPFKIKFGDYQLGVAGVSNTSGNMYFHLALEKSPFHLPFGVGLSGKFSHPEINFGGQHIDDYKPEMIATDPVSAINVNIMSYLHNGWLLFLQEAAKYEGTKQN